MLLLFFAGVRIVANKNIAVFSGNVRTAVDFGTSNVVDKESHLVEQVLGVI